MEVTAEVKVKLDAINSSGAVESITYRYEEVVEVDLIRVEYSPHCVTTAVTDPVWTAVRRSMVAFAKTCETEPDGRGRERNRERKSVRM